MELAKALDACEVFVAVIGPRWMDLLRRRYQDGEFDYVREEIAEALRRGITVIPVRVGREGNMPRLPRSDELPDDLRALILHQKHDVVHERFQRDITDLIQAVEATTTGPSPSGRARRGITVGWRRIGIVLSVIWFISFGGFLWVVEGNRIGEQYVYALTFCRTLLNMANESLQYIQKPDDRDARQSANLAKYDECRADAQSVHARESDRLVGGIPILLAIDAGTLAFGWLVVWLATLVVRWVRRGFVAA
jgi:hypothetical protein